ncbi:MAG: hypothetical protein JXR46_04475 [Calditrichaceae bacterium]|nr:hypothetical protein [Calditrichaceae bacterium]MBN2708282.1 hypothetical protein [Calditrichaceae bacterium]RQV91924.1 MAG: hypothetical protein EH224_16985 [Calditrichota bacterium]
MIKVTEATHKTRLTGFTFLAIINAVAFFVTIIFWGLVFFSHLIPFPGELSSSAERGNSAVTYGFMLGDVFYSAPLLLLAWLGLWKVKSWGWLAAQMANILWIYSMTVILLRDANTSMSPGGLLFIPFLLISIWAIPYLWINRKEFGIS